jgi:hypothetical protein
MARSVVISGGSTSNFSGDELVAVGDGRKIRFMENKELLLPRSRNDAVFFATSERRLFRAGRFGYPILYL